MSSSTVPPVIFLDVQGVLMSGRAWLMPTNRRALRTSTTPMKPPSDELGRAALFDPCAVGLLIEICEATEARLVLSSGWGYINGLKATRAKLIEQGVEDRFFHEHWSCSSNQRGASFKLVGIQNWLKLHNTQEPGSWLIIDQKPHPAPDPSLLVDGMEGLGARDAAAAIRYFGALSNTLGMVRLADDDIPTEVRSAFNGRWIDACQWLEGADGRKKRDQLPSALLARGDREGALRLLPASAVSSQHKQASVGK